MRFQFLSIQLISKKSVALLQLAFACSLTFPSVLVTSIVAIHYLADETTKKIYVKTFFFFAHHSPIVVGVCKDGRGQGLLRISKRGAKEAVS